MDRLALVLLESICRQGTRSSHAGSTYGCLSGALKGLGLSEMVVRRCELLGSEFVMLESGAMERRKTWAGMEQHLWALRRKQKVFESRTRVFSFDAYTKGKTNHCR